MRKALSVSRKAILEKCCSRCMYCGESLSIRTMQVDHVFPVSKGGSDDPSNLVAACPACNVSKGSKTVVEWVGDRVRREPEDISESIKWLTTPLGFGGAGFTYEQIGKLVGRSGGWAHQAQNNPAKVGVNGFQAAVVVSLRSALSAFISELHDINDRVALLRSQQSEIIGAIEEHLKTIARRRKVTR